MTVERLSDRLPSGVHLRGLIDRPDRRSEWDSWLSDAERARRDTFGSEQRQREFLLGRAAARGLLADLLGCAPARVPLRRADDGAVEVRKTAWRVSIAHSDGRALAAAAQRPVGVDLERIRPRDPDVARFLLSDEEWALPATLPFGANESLILLWVLKEATLKARRTGFRTSPKELRVQVQPEAHTATLEVGEQEAWIARFARLDGFWAAVALAEA